jgi:ATP-dependent helicase HrpB
MTTAPGSVSRNAIRHYCTLWNSVRVRHFRVVASMLPPLPIDPALPDIVAALDERRAVVVTAAPGAGKTTRVPPRLTAEGAVLLLQPRRVAARAIARRIAAEQHWTVGREVGWQVRFERRFSSDTRLLVATEGVLTARLQQDPLLSDFRTVVLDEFHERSIHADLGLALARQAWIARADLRIVVMSATIDASRVAGFLGGCPVVDVPGRVYPVEIGYQAGMSMEHAIAARLPRLNGAMLCFLPGAPEIRQVADRVTLGERAVRVLPLHGGLDADDQDAALSPASGPRVILATNLAETTVTVPDVTVVVDSGLHKVARYDPDRAIDSLDTERISADSAAQRSGRAGRTQAGTAIRLWDARDRLRPHREPDIARVDLGPVALDVIGWGGDPATLEWFEPPGAGALASALDLLQRLGALDRDRRLTPLGDTMRRLPVHPRLARLLIDARGAPLATRAVAYLAERRVAAPRHGATACDGRAAGADEGSLPPHVRRVADEVARTTARVIERPADSIAESGFRRAMLAAYPDRVARRRRPRDDRFLLASGSGARLARSSGVYDAAYVVAVDVGSATAAGAGTQEPIIRMATAVDREWLQPTSAAIEHELDRTTGVVRAWRIERYGAIVLDAQPADLDETEAAALLARAYLDRELSDRDRQLLARLAFAGLEIAVDSLASAAAQGRSRLDDVDLRAGLDPRTAHALDRDAPAAITLPAGRTVRLRYDSPSRVVASTRLQDVIGMAETPRLGPRRVPVTFELLAPNGRPVQVTHDLQSFWTRTYPELRTALRTRYPKHRWP